MPYTLCRVDEDYRTKYKAEQVKMKKRKWKSALLTSGICVLILLCCLNCKTVSKTVPKETEEDKMKTAAVQREESISNAKADGKVRKFYNRFETAWEENDLAGYLSLYSEDYMAGYDEEHLFTPKKGLAVLVGEMMGFTYGFHNWKIDITIEKMWEDENGNVRARTYQRQFVNSVSWYDGPGPETVFVERQDGLRILREYAEPAQNKSTDRFIGRWVYPFTGSEYGKAYLLDIVSDQFGNLQFTMEHLVNFVHNTENYESTGWIPFARQGGTIFLSPGDLKTFLLNTAYVTASEFDLKNQVVYGGYGPPIEREDTDFRTVLYRIFPKDSNIYNPAFRYSIEEDKLRLRYISDTGEDTFPAVMEFQLMK